MGKENYQDWTLAIKGAAFWGGFWVHYQDPDMFNRIKSDPTEAKDKEAILELSKLKMKAQGALLITVNMVIKLDLDTLKNLNDDKKPANAYIMWQHLKMKYETRDCISSLLDFKKFIHISLVDDGPLEDQLIHHLELCSHCAINDFSVPKWKYTTLILLALPDSYSYVQESFLTTGSVKDLMSGNWTCHNCVFL